MSGPGACRAERNILAIGTSTSVGKYMKTPKTTPARLASSVLLPATSWIHLRLDEDADDADEEDADHQQRKIIFTKRQVSHSHRCMSQDSKRRACGSSARQSSGTASVRPVTVTARPSPPARRPSAANASVATTSASVSVVSRPRRHPPGRALRQPAAPIAASRPISTTPCSDRFSAPVASVRRHPAVEERLRFADAGPCQHSRQRGADSTSTWSVPAISNATSVATKHSVRRGTRAVSPKARTSPGDRLRSGGRGWP